MIYLTTDTHFGHKKIIEYGRPKNYGERIVHGFNAIKEGDTLIHLGDICIGQDEFWSYIFRALPCNRILVRGNHDHKSAEWYLTHGWHSVCDSFQMIYEGKNIVFSHCPVTPDYWFNKTHYDRYDFNIHGHLHGNDHRSTDPAIAAVFNDRQIALALEDNGYRLFSLPSVLRRGKIKADHSQGGDKK